MRCKRREAGDGPFPWHPITTLIAIGFALWLPKIALGEDSGTTGWRFSEFQWENDDIFPHPSKAPGDRFYTNGLRFTWTKYFGPETDYRFESLPAWARTSSRFLCPSDTCFAYAEAGIGQNFYTPEIIVFAAPQPDERPWAGWLYGHFSLGISRGPPSRHRFELQIGATGNASLAEEVQSRWHRLIHAPAPQGWSNQFDAEIGANLFYEYQYRFHRANDNGFGLDFVPMFSAAGGTIMTYAGVGFDLRIGRHISGFPYRPVPSVAIAPMTKVQTSATTMHLAVRQSLPRWEYYVFVGCEGRGIAHNYFLEGSLFHDDPGAVSPKRFVWDLRYGFSIRRDSWRITYAMIRRGPEFDRTTGTDNGIHNYVSFSLSRYFR